MECSICMTKYKGHIYLCETGHSFCSKCKDKIDSTASPCPRCRMPMTNRRNFDLESLVADFKKAGTSKPSKSHATNKKAPGDMPPKKNPSVESKSAEQKKPRPNPSAAQGAHVEMPFKKNTHVGNKPDQSKKPHFNQPAAQFNKPSASQGKPVVVHKHYTINKVVSGNTFVTNNTKPDASPKNPNKPQKTKNTPQSDASTKAKANPQHGQGPKKSSSGQAKTQETALLSALGSITLKSNKKGEVVVKVNFDKSKK